MPTKLRFEVQGKSPLVYLTFYNDDFEKNLAKINSEELSYNYNDFLQENEVESLNPGQGLEIGPDSVKVFKNNELIYEDFEYVEDVEQENTHPPIVLVSEFDAEVTNVLSHKQNIEVSSFWTEFSDFTQKYNYCSIEKVECYKAAGTVTIDIKEDIVPHYKDFEWVTMGYDTGGLASKLVSFGIDTSLIGVKYKNTFYQFECTNEGGFNEINYYKKVDGKWEWAEDIEEKINEMV
jgi:hypothetical protein